MYMSIPELSRNRENLVIASLQASAACLSATERLAQLAVQSGAQALATQQKQLQGDGVIRQDELLAAHHENWINCFQELCGIACETQVQLLTALETRIRGVDQIAQSAIRRDMDTLPPETEPLLAGAKAAVACVDTAVLALADGGRQAMADLEATVASLDAAKFAETDSEGGNPD